MADFFKGGTEGSKPWGDDFRSSRGFIIAVIAIAVFTDIFIYGCIIPILPVVLRTRAHLPDDQLQTWISILLAAFGGATLISAPMFGYFADQGSSRKLPFILGLIALAGSTIMFWIARTPYYLFVARILQGVSGAAVWTVGTALIVDTMGKEQAGVAMGYVSMAATMGTVLGPSLGGVILDRAGYHAVFAIAIAIIGVDIFLRLLMIERRAGAKGKAVENNNETELLLDGSRGGDAANYQADTEQQTGQSIPSDSEPERPSAESAQNRENEEPVEPTPSKRHLIIPPIVRLVGSPKMLVVLAASVCNAVSMNSFETILPLFLMRTFHYGPLGVGLCFLPLFIPSFLSPIIGQAIDSYGPRIPSFLGFVGSVPGFILLRLVTSGSIGHEILLFASLTIAGLSLVTQVVSVMVEVGAVVEDKEKEQPGIFGEGGGTAQAYALFNITYASGQMIGPLISGGLVETAGWATTVTVMGAISAATAILLGCTDQRIFGSFWNTEESSEGGA